MELRDYQRQCIDIIDNLDPGAYLVQMATGLGKTVTFANIRRRGRVLLLSHREELVHQPEKYYTCSYGVERANECSHGEEVISASVQSLVRRLDKFAPDTFDTIICDEAHHAAAVTYRSIFNHFAPRLLLGFTATPARGDKVRLDDIFDRIIFQRDLRWGIQNGYLCDITCKRVDIGYDLSAVKTARGDYAPGELNDAMEGTADAIAQAYREHAVGQTLIFAVSVERCNEIAEKIPGAVVVTGETKNRAEIIERFTRREIPCIVNCMVFTEGTDMPLIETIIVARPTQSDSLYTQMVGRGLRLYPGKDKLTLIDCVGITGRASLCTAPSLIGVDMTTVPQERRSLVEGDLFELPLRADYAADCPQSWIRNVEIVDLWAKEQRYNLHGVGWFKMPDGTMLLSLPNNEKIRITAPDPLGNVIFRREKMPMQEALDSVYSWLQEYRQEERLLWDIDCMKRWGKQPASERQIEIIRKRCKGFDPTGLTKMQATQILNRLFGEKKGRRSA
ncbi:MAG: DEAD/DEAH box helicase [Oscillospiraceae bacterium]|nr:DEAD/DEAH box helicase [Oscillospiraceae bacterium]